MSREDILSRDLIPFSKLPSLLPSRPHLSTCHRWRLRGVRGIRLQTLLIGGRRFVDRDDLNRFVEQLSAGDSSTQNSESPTAHSRRRQKEIERADRECDQAGL